MKFLKHKDISTYNYYSILAYNPHLPLYAYSASSIATNQQKFYNYQRECVELYTRDRP